MLADPIDFDVALAPKPAASPKSIIPTIITGSLAGLVAALMIFGVAHAGSQSHVSTLSPADAQADPTTVVDVPTTVPPAPVDTVAVEPEPTVAPTTMRPSPPTTVAPTAREARVPGAPAPAAITADPEPAPEPSVDPPPPTEPGVVTTAPPKPSTRIPGPDAIP